MVTPYSEEIIIDTVDEVMQKYKLIDDGDDDGDGRNGGSSGSQATREKMKLKLVQGDADELPYATSWRRSFPCAFPHRLQPQVAD